VFRKGRLTIREAAMQLTLSYRHCRRVYKRFCEQGDKGLVQMDDGHNQRFGDKEPARSEIRLHHMSKSERVL